MDNAKISYYELDYKLMELYDALHTHETDQQHIDSLKFDIAMIRESLVSFGYFKEKEPITIAQA